MALWVDVLALAFGHLLLPFLAIVLAEIVSNQQFKQYLAKLKVQLMHTLLVGVVFPFVVFTATAALPLHTTTFLTNVLIAAQALLVVAPFFSSLVSCVVGANLAVRLGAVWVNLAATLAGCFGAVVWWSAVAAPTSIGLSNSIPAMLVGGIAAAGMTYATTTSHISLDKDN